MKELAGWLKDAGIGWYEDKAMRLSSSLAYYALLSLAPIVVLTASLAGLILDDAALAGHVEKKISKLISVEAASLIESVIIDHARAPRESWWASMVGLVVLLFGASAVCTELQAAMNSVWHVKPKPGSRMFGLVRRHLMGAAMVLGVAVLLLMSLALAVALTTFETRLAALPGGPKLWQLFTFGFALVVATALFVLCFKVIPDVELRFRDVWLGAVVAALLFALGELALGAYLSSSLFSSPVGVESSVIVLVLWVYYSAQILLYGAELTKARALGLGTRLVPSAHAVCTLRAGP